MTRRRSEALQAEVERLNALLADGLLGRLMGFWRRTSTFGWRNTRVTGGSAASYTEAKL